MTLDEDLEIGKGRLAVVRKGVDSQGKPIARKILVGSWLAKLTNYFFSGAPNSYIWSEDAVKTADYRREILPELVDYWFGQKLRVAKAVAYIWNEQFKAYELQTEFVDGRHASLHHSFSQKREAELSDLVNNIMKPLQEKLIEAGFDGLVWQAGKGVPNASANFMLENNDYGENKWVWIDLESSVPAIIPLNVFTLLSFYIPKSIKHRRPLFDDVDIAKLRRYIGTNQESLKNKLGTERFWALYNNVTNLEFYQQKWKSMRRAHRSITYQLKKEKINQQQADWYFRHPYIWYGREMGRMSGEAYKKLFIDLPEELINKILSINYKEIALKAWKLISLEAYRVEVARNYISRGTDEWKSRKQLEKDQADYFHVQLKNEVASPYLADFGVHIGIIFPLSRIRYIVLPVLYQQGTIDLETFSALTVFGGAILRTAYTGSRMLYNLAQNLNFENIKRAPYATKKFIKELYHSTRTDGIEGGFFYTILKVLEINRMMALIIGTFPAGGNGAYPTQMAYSGSKPDRDIGAFGLYRIFSKIGEIIPIYGGRDTRTEHFFNHFPDLIIRNRRGLSS